MPDPVNPGEVLDTHVDVFSQAIDDCLNLYRSSAELWIRSLPGETSARVADATYGLMDDLSRGLLIKTFLAIMQADRKFSSHERTLAQVLILKVWGRSLLPEEVGPVLQELMPMADKFDWYSLVRPFETIPALRERTSELETIVMRFGNSVAKADGTLGPEEALQLKNLLAQINRHLRPVPLEGDEKLPGDTPYQAMRQRENSPAIGQPGSATSSTTPATAPVTDEKRLSAAIQSLDELIGLDSVKSDVRELARFLRVQQQREKAGLPRTQVSLHTVFVGNPGTGKTSVARILGEVFGALGIVIKGHLIEADRSTLVAGYMGQTADRTHKAIDRALDGVLFIDEAYGLVNEDGEDSFGREAVQILLKRMEDDRDRLVVVLAGYPAEMEQFLNTNPGLASRFQRTFVFPDYTVVELCQIFQALCEKNHYVMPGETRARLILGFEYLLLHRDEHFGNGRLVRNAFEQAIRRLANRVADVVPLTKELLTRLEPQDILLPDVPEAAINAERARGLQVNVVCAGCQQTSTLQAVHLGRRARCNRCQLQFNADWGKPATG